MPVDTQLITYETMALHHKHACRGALCWDFVMINCNVLWLVGHTSQFSFNHDVLLGVLIMAEPKMTNATPAILKFLNNQVSTGIENLYLAIPDNSADYT